MHRPNTFTRPPVQQCRRADKPTVLLMTTPRSLSNGNAGRGCRSPGPAKAGLFRLIRYLPTVMTMTTIHRMMLEHEVTIFRCRTRKRIENLCNESANAAKNRCDA